MPIRFWYAFTCCLLVGAIAAADEVDYLKQIKPILTEKCYSCHGVLKQESGLRLDTRELMLEGAVIEPGDAAMSTMLARVSSSNEDRMPPPEDGAALRSEDIAILESWIEQGAPAPAETIPGGPADHWAFQPIERPSARDANAPNSIDAFIDSQHAHYSLQPVPPAERSLLLRRLYLDLIGLPPSLQQLADDRPWDEIVNELLASPHHGERWGRHWMDVWRYSDDYGLGAQLRFSQKHMWHWRDWIVESLNADKGYDQMIMEMLAGDELAPADPQVVRATGFLARNYYLFNRTTWLDSTVEHTGKAFLGLTLNCAKCHDHKYDPITHVDYYSFRAIFEPHQVRLDPVPGEINFEKDGLPRVFDEHLTEPTFLHLRGDPLYPDKTTVIEARVPALFSSFQPSIEPVRLPLTAYAPGVRHYVGSARLTEAQSAVTAAENDLEQAKERVAELERRIAREKPPAPQTPFLVADDFDAFREDLWEIAGDGWKVQDGTLRQTQSTRDEQFARLKRTLPPDFELTCRYVTTGGSTYKSVTFRFDESEDTKVSNTVYTSAHTPGPKIQIAHTRNGNAIYPPEGRQSHPIQIGTSYELRFAVRDTLVNVWLDDQFMLAYRLPDRHPSGRLSLSGFDATVDFDSVKICDLSSTTKLTEPSDKPRPSSADAETTLRIAEFKLNAAVAKRDAIAAENAYNQSRQKREDPLLKQAAAITQAKHRVADAKLNVLLSQKTNGEKLEAAEKALAAAAEKLAASENGQDTFTPYRGAKKALESPADNEETHPATYPETSTGRRLALARWIVARENPLTARVAVNHVWMRHFGEPLVESVFDFGLRAPQPIHKDLLDYLAVEFIESGWSFRHLHRLIVTSQAYRRSSSNLDANQATLNFDPTNQYLWRTHTRRMESQIVRDSLLKLAGQLDDRIGGPSVDVGNHSRRRSIYFQHSRDEHDQFLTMFDDADLLQCYRRTESIVPQQALALSNSKLALDLSMAIAERFSENLDPDVPFFEAALSFLLARRPTPEELAAGSQFAAELAELISQEHPELHSAEVDLRVRSRIVHVLVNHNDFISIR